MPENEQTIFYWQDGYWITDQEEAELLDSVNAFGGEHRVLTIPEGTDIQQAINQQIEEGTNQLTE